MSSKSSSHSLEIIEVSPTLAAKWLEKNVRNRPLSRAHVAALAATMARGEYKLTAEPIQFCDAWKDPHTGEEFGETLMEGQHRLSAVVQSGATISFCVVRHCDPTEFEVIGRAKERTHADLIGINRRDLKNPALVASVVTAFLRFGASYSVSIQPWAVRETLAALGPEILRVVSYKQKLKSLVRREFLAGLVLAELIDPVRTEGLVNNLRAGLGYTRHDPAKPLREYLFEYKIALTRDLPDVYFIKICYGLANTLRAQPATGKLKHDPAGLGWLRTSAKSRLAPLMKKLGRTPEDFYAPTITERE